VISYFVTVEEAQPMLPDLALLRPAPDAELPLVPGTLQSPNFRWEGLGLGHTYRITLDGEARGGVAFVQPGIQTPPPLVVADTPFPYYNLSFYDMDRFIRGAPYTWQVTARRDGQDVARSEARTVFFTDPVVPEGDVELRSLTFTGGSGASGTGELDIAGEEEVGISVTVDNRSAQPLTNRRVEFLVDDEIADLLFVSSLDAGGSVALASTWYVGDDFSHTVSVRLLEGPDAGDLVQAVLAGYLVGEDGQQADLPDEPPEEG